jgi:hypothetical protein
MTFLGFHGVHPLSLLALPLVLGLICGGFALLGHFRSRLPEGPAARLKAAYHQAFAASCLVLVCLFFFAGLLRGYLLFFYLGVAAWFVLLNAALGLVLLLKTRPLEPQDRDFVPMPSRRGFLAGSMCLAACSLGGVAVAGAVAGPELVAARGLRLARPGRAKGRGPLKLSVISDTHAGFFLPQEGLAQALKHVADFSPDAVLFAGDLVEFETEAMRETGWFLEALAGLAPVYAVLGNHDCYQDPDQVADFHRTHGVAVLRGDCATLAGRWGSITLAGTKDFKEPKFSLACLNGLDLENTVLLTHNPDAVLTIPDDLVPWLSVCGHTHGGQWRLPGVGPLVNQADRRFQPGLNLVDGRRVLLTAGLGYSGLPVRIFCPPEVSNLVLG